MSRYKENHIFKPFFKHIYLSYIPNSKDNLKQILIKVFFLVSLFTLIISAGYLTNYFLTASRQDKVIDQAREVWHSMPDEDEDTSAIVDPTSVLLAENGDFKGWITINNTRVDNPIYQTTDNQYYLTHNQKKQSSAYGALFFDYNNTISKDATDSNLVIYGHDMKNGSMFGTLKKFKALNFYKENPTIKFSTLYKNSTYKIFSIFILNASKTDDNGYIYNIARNSFFDSADFTAWTDEAYERSIINTGVDTQLGDKIITLVTCSDDFDNARLIIMARETRDGESEAVNTHGAVVNPSPRYPKLWYEKRGIDYPFN